ncbi:MAG: anhydro-N-acetylmuramic acid kinase [Pseudomonadota bacterium]
MQADTAEPADRSDLYIGAMTGTSIDGLDLCLVDFATTPPRLAAHHQHPLGSELTTRLRALATGKTPTSLPDEAGDAIDLLGTTDRALAEATAAGVQALLTTVDLSPSDIRAIGSHGQTVRHRPAWGTDAFTLQIGDPNRIAEITGIPVACDFRRRDMAAGGQGAPLVPAAHAALFPPKEASGTTLVVNLGGIANLSVIERDADPLGFDTGPANTLMDAWHARHRGQPFDADGRWAAAGTANVDLLERLLGDPYFTANPPKSTGPEHFNLDWLERTAGPWLERIEPQDVQATLLELTATSVTQAMRPWVAREERETEVIVCGGGARNAHLMERLGEHLEGQNAVIATSTSRGFPPETVEGAAFAWLARQLEHRRPGNAPSVTGATGWRVLGGWYPA